MRKAILAAVLAATTLTAATRPKVRAITAFIDVDASGYAAQIADAVKFLGTVRSAYQAAGWDVETIRIATQPFPQYTKGLNHDAALAVLRGIDGLGAKLG